MGEVPNSDANGRFNVRVHADTHTLMVDAPGFFPWFVRLFAATGSDGEYDFGQIVLEHERTVSGRILDAASGAPVVDAIVRHSSRQYDDPYLRMLTINWFGNRTLYALTREARTTLGSCPPKRAFLKSLSLAAGLDTSEYLRRLPNLTSKSRSTGSSPDH